VDRVKHGALGDDRRAEAPTSTPRRAPHAQTKGSSLPPRTGQYRPGSSPAPRVTAVRTGEDRYRPGGRRTSAEPLRASWQPKVEDEERPTRARKQTPGKISSLKKTFGWRAYAIPVLIVITVLIAFNTARTPAAPVGDDNQISAASSAAGGGSIDGANGVLPENPAQPVDLRIPTAELPDGSPFTQAGKGTWHVMPGKGDKVGKGKLYTYTVEVEDGIDPSSYAGDDSFALAVQGTLSDARSWTWDGQFALQRVDASFPNPSFRVSLTSPDTTHRADMCGYQIKEEASCYRRSEGRVLINLSRWVRGAKAFGADMTAYRQYAINHEVGHALGGTHVGCPVDGGPAPVMMQQSFGVADNYVAMLNNVPGGDAGKVNADGKVCRPNSWPDTSGS
jgi:hypothetical protein